MPGGTHVGPTGGQPAGHGLFMFTSMFATSQHSVFIFEAWGNKNLDVISCSLFCLIKPQAFYAIGQGNVRNTVYLYILQVIYIMVKLNTDLLFESSHSHSTYMSLRCAFLVKKLFVLTYSSFK